VNARVIGHHLMGLSRHVAASMSDKAPTDSLVSLALALILGFSTIGFLCGYLYTRLFLQGAFQRSDSQFYKVLDVALKTNTAGFVKDGVPVVPTPSDVTIAKKSKTHFPETILKRLSPVSMVWLTTMNRRGSQCLQVIVVR
jgi:hypothetical protein